METRGINAAFSFGAALAHETIEDAKAPIGVLCARSQLCAKIAGTVVACMDKINASPTGRKIKAGALIGLSLGATVGMCALLTSYPEETMLAGAMVYGVAMVYLFFSFLLRKAYRELVDEGINKVLEEARKQTRNDLEMTSVVLERDIINLTF